MKHSCNICRYDLGFPIYTSSDNVSITTMCKKIAGKSKVYYCEKCGHLQTSELANLAEYYAAEYEVNLHSEDDDQMYEVAGDEIVYRTDKQAEVTLSKINVVESTKILDFGCAKASTLKQIATRNPNVVPYAFDVTDKYVRFWDSFIQDSNYSVFETKPEWKSSFDIIVSYFALEHISDVIGCVQRVHRLLRDEGEFLFMVPNVYGNIADFIVADHINHFSVNSIRYLMNENGFDQVSVDSTSYRAAYVVKGTKVNHDPDIPSVKSDDKGKVLQMADYWNTIKGRIASSELNGDPLQPTAVYGAGFYGGYILTCLSSRENIACFIDQNEQLQGRMIENFKIIPPQETPESIRRIYVGLNPKNAREIIAETPIPRKDEIEFIYLLEVTTQVNG